MANIDIIGNAGFVQNQIERGRQAGERRLTRRLAGQTIAGDPQAAAQLAAIDPVAAKQAQGFGDDQVLRLEGLLNFMDQAEKSGNPQAAQQAWQMYGAPYVRQFANGTEPTQNWAEAKPLLEGVRAKIAGIKSARAGAQAGNQPSGFQEAHLSALAAGYQPGTPEYQRAMRIKLGTEAGLARTQPKVFTTDLDGVPTTFEYDPATRTFRQATVGGAPAPQTPPTQTPPLASNGANYAPTPGDETAQLEADIGRPLTQEERATIAAGGTLRFPAGSVPPAPDMPAQTAPAAAGAPGRPIVGRTKEAEAFATEGATQAARTAALAEQKRIEREAATQQALDIERGKTGVGVQAKAEQQIRDSAQILSLLDDVARILPSAEGGIGERLVGDVLGAFNVTTEGREATAQLGTLAARLVGFVPRFEGPQSDKDAQLYREAAGDFANANKTTGERLAALAEMRRLATKYLNQAQAGGGAQGGGNVATPQTDAEYNALPSGALFVDPDDGQTYRKP